MNKIFGTCMIAAGLLFVFVGIYDEQMMKATAAPAGLLIGFGVAIINR